MSQLKAGWWGLDRGFAKHTFHMGIWYVHRNFKTRVADGRRIWIPLFMEYTLSHLGPGKMILIAGHYLIDICLNFSKMQKLTPKFSVVTSWWRHKAWEHFFRNDKFSGKFFGQNSAFELKIDPILLIGNRLSFPKHPSKSRLSLLIIEIIALKDKQYRPKTTKTVIELEVKPEHFSF